ncbi:hypothetical protein PHYPSEUDO_004421 [Phytophthora pseudosyringae]|uniref:Centrosomal protein of 162 kDa n=1 Tax=Phytophthora pseudosyringae TaxID=221518 RepID=A0A8T1WMN4_9STRA|nr:hypothetical protein PHYPSEUDO_004421 [Phytophthora pseudosyringae]
MADSDSDGEFERFLQEDENSLSPEPTKRRSQPSGAYTLSSASAVTAAAAALLASSKLTKNHKNKSKSKSSDKKKSGKRSSKTQFSDSEEAPPGYYDDFSAERHARLDDSDADPYAFDMTSPGLPTSVTKEEDEESDDEYEMKKRKKKKEDFKTLAKKAVAKSAPISMEDRIAEILKRTGSTHFQADEKSDEDEISDKESDEKKTTEPPARNEENSSNFQHEDQRSDNIYSGSDAERSSVSDSLGMESADFEVRLPPKRSLDRPRLSLSSLDSENFAVNRDALNSELATPSRYEHQQIEFLKSEQDEDSTTEKDEYGDDDFDVSASADVQQKPLEASDAFGYGEDEFEETERSRQEDVIPAMSDDHEASGTAQYSAQATEDVEYSADYDDDAFDAEPVLLNEAPSSAPSETLEATEGNTHDADTPIVNDDIADKSSKTDALLAKYGDFYTQEDDDEPATKSISNEAAQPTLETQKISEQTTAGAASTEKAINVPAPSSTPFAILTKTVDSPPSSPPPPPPPADEDDDKQLQIFTLDAPRSGREAKAQPAALQYSGSVATARENVQPLSAADRFRQIENHVASLRFVQPGTPNLAAANSPSTESVHPVSSKVLAGYRDTDLVVHPPPFIEPISISFDAGLLAEDEDTQREIDEFVRSSQVMRQEKRSAAQRASIARENGLVLRLQQAQRQILQLKEHIQATAASETPHLGRGKLVTSKSVDAEAEGDKQDTEDYVAARRESTNISQATYNKLQKEIKTQDTLIAAFQKENERLMQQLKQVRQDVHYDVHEANEELRRQIKKLQDQLGEAATLGGGGDLTSKAQYRVAVEARLEAEAHTIALHDELAAVRLSHQQKLNEVTLELDRVKKAKVELECRYEGVDLTQIAQETQHARELQNELDLCKKEHARALAALQKKLDWYVENQRLQDDQDDELRRLRRQVDAQTPEPTPSKDQRDKSKAGGPSPARSHRRSPNDIRRIQELEGRLAELEEAMRRRHPDSLANLILASRRADEESKTRALEHDFEEKVAALSRELEQAHEASETKLASFRQQQEKLLLQYRRKIKEQEKQLKQLGKAPLSHRPTTSRDVTGSSTTSDAELAKVRRFYTDKIKELERKWEAKYRSLRKQQYSGLGSNQQTQEGLTYADSAVVIANLQRQIREQELEMKQEKAKVEQLEAESQLVSTAPEDSPLSEVIKSKQTQDDKRKELEEQVADLKAQLEDSESARARLAQTLTAVQTLGLARALNSETVPTAAVTESSRAVEPDVSQQTQTELAQVRKDFDAARVALSSERATATEKIDRLEKQVAGLIEKNAALEAQLAGNQREMQSLQKLALGAERHNRSLEAQAQRVPELEEEVLALRRDLELPRTPSMVQYRSLELQVATLEQKHKLREAELKVVLDRALTSTHLERLSRERAHRAAIAAKNAEIASFKRQLEEILDELAQLQPSTKTPNQPEEDDEDATW